MVYQGVLKQRQQERTRDLSKSETSTVIEGVNKLGKDDETKQKEKSSDCGGENSASTDVDAATTMKEIKLSLLDVNPFKPVGLILRRWNNLAILIASGKLHWM
jgi:hypothetical protein